MVERMTFWIAPTQRLSPESVLLVRNGSEYQILVPSRTTGWYVVFVLIICGIPLTIALVSFFAFKETVIRLSIAIFSLFVAIALALERQISIINAESQILIKYRIGCIPICVWQRRILFTKGMTIRAVGTKDVDGLRQVEIAIFDGCRQIRTLLTFVGGLGTRGWGNLPQAKGFAEELSSILEKRSD